MGFMAFAYGTDEFCPVVLCTTKAETSTGRRHILNFDDLDPLSVSKFSNIQKTFNAFLFWYNAENAHFQRRDFVVMFLIFFFFNAH